MKRQEGIRRGAREVLAGDRGGRGGWEVWGGQEVAGVLEDSFLILLQNMCLEKDLTFRR